MIIPCLALIITAYSSPPKSRRLSSYLEHFDTFLNGIPSSPPTHLPSILDSAPEYCNVPSWSCRSPAKILPIFPPSTSGKEFEGLTLQHLAPAHLSASPLPLLLLSHGFSCSCILVAPCAYFGPGHLTQCSFLGLHVKTTETTKDGSARPEIRESLMSSVWETQVKIISSWHWRLTPSPDCNCPMGFWFMFSVLLDFRHRSLSSSDSSVCDAVSSLCSHKSLFCFLDLFLLFPVPTSSLALSLGSHSTVFAVCPFIFFVALPIAYSWFVYTIFNFTDGRGLWISFCTFSFLHPTPCVAAKIPDHRSNDSQNSTTCISHVHLSPPPGTTPTCNPHLTMSVNTAVHRPSGAQLRISSRYIPRNAIVRKWSIYIFYFDQPNVIKLFSRMAAPIYNPMFWGSRISENLMRFLKTFLQKE